MASQQDYEDIVNLGTRYADFKITSRDLPSTNGRLEQYLIERNLPAKKIRYALITILFITPIITVSLFFFTHPSIQNLTQVQSLSQTDQGEPL